jgi:hypothetical protein
MLIQTYKNLSFYSITDVRLAEQRLKVVLFQYDETSLYSSHVPSVQILEDGLCGEIELFENVPNRYFL